MRPSFPTSVINVADASSSVKGAVVQDDLIIEGKRSYGPALQQPDLVLL